MATKSSIEWTDSTWNPVTGCTRESKGCDLCYAVRMTKRLEAMGQEKYTGLVNLGKKHFNGRIKTHPDALDAPKAWKEPQVIFVNSMSDLFHRDVPIDFIRKVFDVMEEASHHIYQVLTKRPKRMAEVLASLQLSSGQSFSNNPLENVWLGTSVEDEEATHRIRSLQEVPAAIRFLSLEPLLGPLEKLELTGIDWVIVGGESGFGARPMRKHWVIDIREQCQKARVPFFFKQWGGVNKKKTGRSLEGRTWDDMPESIVTLAA